MHPLPFVDRDSQVDAVLGYAAEAGAGTGRLVLVEGEAGVGKSTLLEQVEARLPDATWHWGACDGLFTPLPLAPLRDIAASIGGPLLAASRADASRETLFAALLEAVRADPGLDGARRRGRAVGRRGDPRPAALPRQAHPEGAGAAARHVPRGGLGVVEHPAQGARRAGAAARHPQGQPRSPLPPCGRAAGRRHRPRPGRGAPPHRRQPLLRRRGGGQRGRRAPGIRPRRRAGPRRAPRPDAPAPARRRRPGRLPRRPRAARGGRGRARGGLRDPRRRRAARHRRALAAVPARDRPPVGRGCRARATAHHPPPAPPRRAARARRR